MVSATRKQLIKKLSGIRSSPDTENTPLYITAVPSAEKRHKMKNSFRTRTQSKSGTKVVLLQGTFDILNWGHVKAFQRAKAQGDYLIVALNTNRLVKKFKGRDAVLPWYQKKFIIESCRFVDLVVPASDFSPLRLLKRYKVDVYVLTREWHDTKAREIAYMKKKGGRVVYSPRFKGVVPTSKIKEILLKEATKGGKR